jgi:hypothetical protein
MRFQPVTSWDSLARRVDELGFLSLCRSRVPGLSVEELTPPEYWFVKGVDGPWEWRQQAIDRFAYAKLLGRNAGFVSHEWFPALCNFRRDGLDFDARYEDGRIPQMGKRVYELIAEHSRSTPELKSLVSGSESGYERAITALQMSTDVLIVGFDAKIDSLGRPYGWGVSRYDLADRMLGELTRSAFDEDPQDSFRRMKSHILSLCPEADPKVVEKLLRG